MIGSTNVSPAVLVRMIGRMNNIQTITVPASDWQGSSVSYYQDISITGYQGAQVTSSDRPEIFFNTDNVAQNNAEAYAEQCSYINKVQTRDDGKIRVLAYEKPTMDIYIDVKGV